MKQFTILLALFAFGHCCSPELAAVCDTDPAACLKFCEENPEACLAMCEENPDKCPLETETTTGGTDPTETTTTGETTTTTAEKSDEPGEGNAAMNPADLNRQSCNNLCSGNDLRTTGLIIDFDSQIFTREFQNWEMECECFKEVPEVADINAQCLDEDAGPSKARELCDRMAQFRSCFEGWDEDGLHPVEFYMRGCLFDMCPPKQTDGLVYLDRDTSEWGPWCVAMQTLEDECFAFNPDFEAPDWLTGSYCTGK